MFINFIVEHDRQPKIASTTFKWRLRNIAEFQTTTNYQWLMEIYLLKVDFALTMKKINENPESVMSKSPMIRVCFGQ